MHILLQTIVHQRRDALKPYLFFIVFYVVLASIDGTACCEKPSQVHDDLITIWPLVDYRENSANKSTKLSLLGPLFTTEQTAGDKITTFRPLFHATGDQEASRRFSYILYPLASAETTPDVDRFEVLQLLQKNTFRKTEPGNDERQFMLFPFIITGDSKKYGPYTSIFPLYGDIYERFWRDEYHFALFPLYGRTVNKGTTTYNLLWPIFSITDGEQESGFRVWPLYGQAAKQGRYRSRFFLWPLYSSEQQWSDDALLAERLTLFPLYASFDSPTVTSRTWLWPFFGYATDTKTDEHEYDYFWPFWLTVRGEQRSVTRFLPFYAQEETADASKNWYFWPLYRSDTMQSPHYRQERQNLLYFLYNNKTERWAKDGKDRQRTSLWPLFLYTRTPDGDKSLTLPAPLEPLLDKEGIEKLWAPLWRIYEQHWNDRGEGSLSLFWNLYWFSANSEAQGWELFPIYRQRTASSFHEVQILKGLINFNENGADRRLSLFWLPFGFEWQHDNPSAKERTP